MLKKIKQLSITIAAALMLAVPTLAPVMVHADTISDNVCVGVNTATTADGASCADTTGADTTLDKVIKLVIKYFSIIVGAVSVIMIIYGGFKYVTSGGNDSSVSSAKTTILYAVIGLVVVALAQVIVRFVLTQATT